MALFKPNYKFRRVTDISAAFLKDAGIGSLILDVDNTLSTHHGNVLVDGLQEWLDTMKASGINLIILSNSKKRRVEPFAQRIGLPFISLGLKPLPFGYLRAIKQLKFSRKNTAIVGDQIFTDIIGGNFLGIKTILLTPIKPEPMLSFRIRRNLEKKIIKKYNITDLEV